MTAGTDTLTTRFVYMQVSPVWVGQFAAIPADGVPSLVFQTNSMCFRKKTSCVRRRYSEFVWLRHCLEQNALML